MDNNGKLNLVKSFSIFRDYQAGENYALMKPVFPVYGYMEDKNGLYR
jgi:hypothetical protein